MTWNNTFRQESIPPDGGILHKDKPLTRVAKAVTEIQERVVVDVDPSGDDRIDVDASITENTLKIRVTMKDNGENPDENPHANDPKPGGGGGAIEWPPGGSAGMVLSWRESGPPVWDYVRAV